MDYRVVARVSNSSVIPFVEFVAYEDLTFPDDSNVFGRILEARCFFKKKYGDSCCVEFLEVIPKERINL